ncbi:hypothetical protein [uncultured Jannaschia sp.]|uniref:hypothetical protein n=1 Tax=uncultured Jannaschia sp. TaxID=293347 RepID=UPI0026091A14|nr:hypothetical protein [uncultured Jannaschia sp.]
MLPFRALTFLVAAGAAVATQPAAAQLTNLDLATITAIEDTLDNRLPPKGLDLCDVAKSDWDDTLGDLLTGDWDMTNGYGISTVGAVQTDLTDEIVTEIVVSRQTGQGIVINGAPLPEVVPLQFHKGESWPFNADGSVTFAAGDVLVAPLNTMPLDCEAGDLPRLQAKGPINLPEGVGEFDLWLYVLSTEEAYGAHQMELIQANGQPISILRFVTFEKR